MHLITRGSLFQESGPATGNECRPKPVNACGMLFSPFCAARNSARPSRWVTGVTMSRRKSTTPVHHYWNYSVTKCTSHFLRLFLCFDFLCFDSCFRLRDFCSSLVGNVLTVVVSSTSDSRSELFQQHISVTLATLIHTFSCSISCNTTSEATLVNCVAQCRCQCI